MKAAFENYGPVDTIVYMTDGYPNTALSRGCGACRCGQSGQWIVNEADGWMAPHRAANARFKLFVIQVGGSPIGTMVALGAKQNAQFYLK